MATVQQVYNAALAIMHEADDVSYEQRVVPLVNTLIGQCWQMSAEYDMEQGYVAPRGSENR